MLPSFLACALCVTEIVLAQPSSNNDAIQTVYRQGVPHTNRQGEVRLTYDQNASFFPIGIWGAQLPGKQWDSEADWSLLKEAGFNTVWPWFSPLEQALDAATAYDMQLVYMGAVKPEERALLGSSTHLLGNVWYDEPIGKLGSVDMEALFAEFNAYRAEIHAVAPKLPVFINDAPWIMPPATDWWLKWNAAARISCHDNYPIMNKKHRARSIGAEPNGIPQSVSLGVSNGEEKRPQWLIVGAFDQPGEYGESFPFRFPTPQQLRAQVYAGIIHGATGIIYFTWDTYIPRDGGVIGMAPNPKTAYTPVPRQEGYTKPLPATPMQLVQSRALWEAATQINEELQALAPIIFLPTTDESLGLTLAVEGEAETENPIRILAKPTGNGSFILLTVNLDDAMLRGTFEFTRTVTHAATRFEQQIPLVLEEEAHAFSMSYEPFAVHVLQIKLAEP